MSRLHGDADRGDAGSSCRHRGRAGDRRGLGARVPVARHGGGASSTTSTRRSTHIRRWSSGHTEAIVTEDLRAAGAFVAGVDAAAVMVNASTRFTDGGEFGFGAEIGISTQKLHARGPDGRCPS